MAGWMVALSVSGSCKGLVRRQLGVSQRATGNDLGEAYLPRASTDACDEKQSAYWYVKLLVHVLVRAVDEVIVQAPREALSRAVIGRRLIVTLQRRDRRYGEFATED